MDDAKEAVADSLSARVFDSEMSLEKLANTDIKSAIVNASVIAPV